MIQTIRLRNFRSHVDTTVHLNGMTVLVGPNSAGKTAFLSSLHCLNRLCGASFWDVFRGYLSPEFLARTGENGFSIGAKGHGPETGTWSVDVQVFRTPKEWEGRFEWETELCGSGEVDQWDRPISDDLPDALRRVLFHAVFLKLNPHRLAEPSTTLKTPPRVEFDGSGLASAFTYLLTYERERYDQLMESLRAIIPGVRRIRSRPTNVRVTERRTLELDGVRTTFDDHRDVPGNELVFDMEAGTGLPAHAVSDGTILTVGLLTVLFSPTCPNLVLLDDVEQSLHPKAQRNLMATLSAIRGQQKHIQLVMSTHSPFVVDDMPPENVWVMATDASGTTKSRALSEHPAAEEALQVLTVGEFLGAEQEDWVLGNQEE